MTSLCKTVSRSERIAIIPASTHVALSSAPLKPTVAFAMAGRRTFFVFMDER